MKNIPFGAIAIWTLADKLAVGLQQLLADARKFHVKQISRSDLFACNRETEAETRIPFITEVGDANARKILSAKQAPWQPGARRRPGGNSPHSMRASRPERAC
jgi:hypothetical protein